MKRIRIEFILMAAAVAVTGIHITRYFESTDGIYLSVIQGTALSVATIYFAHKVTTHTGGAGGRVFFLLSLSIMIAYSVGFQYLHFVKDSVLNLEYLARAAWAPTIEILVGIAVGVTGHASTETPKTTAGSRWSVLGDALINRAVSAVDAPETPANTGTGSTSIEPETDTETPSETPSETKTNTGTVEDTETPVPEAETVKDVGTADIVNAYALNPGASYQTIADVLGVSKSFIGKRVPGLVEDGTLYKNGNGVTVPQS